MSKSFPTTVADLNFEDDIISSQSVYSSLKELRRSTLSIPNRLRSILEDAKYVREVAETYSRGSAPLPLIANERCGSWYIPPETKAGSAYFKSTDGHFGQWKFSLRRLNLQVLAIVGRHDGGAVIVDSTRRGKSMPDALSKTLPIWVAVMNRVLFPDRKESHAFQGPPEECRLGDSEVAQITAKLADFVDDFRKLELNVERLRRDIHKPVRLFWAFDHSTEVRESTGIRYGHEPTPHEYHPLILCSASRRVLGAEMSEGGYIQGAGDDSEGWSHCLTPQLFWQHKETLLDLAESELPSLIEKVLANDHFDRGRSGAVLIAPTSNLHIASWLGNEDSIKHQSQLQNEFNTGNDLSKNVQMREDTTYDLFIYCNTPDDFIWKANKLDLGCRKGKLGSRDLREKLGAVKSFVSTTFERDPKCQILITCESGTDLSIGVALMLLCLFFNDLGELLAAPGCTVDNSSENLGELGGTLSPLRIDKDFVRRRLAWILSSHPSANPSRSTLQSVNAFLMDRPD